MEDYRKMLEGRDEPTQLISLRVPANILRTFKALARRKGLRYQSHLVALMRQWISET